MTPLLILLVSLIVAVSPVSVGLAVLSGAVVLFGSLIVNKLEEIRDAIRSLHIPGR